MSSNTFRKGDASSCLVVGKSWNEIINKPDFYDELAVRIVKMLTAAESLGILRRPDTFTAVKETINKVLLEPLRKNLSDLPISESSHTKGYILADAFWDEILSAGGVDLTRLKLALERAGAMRTAINEHAPLGVKDTLQDVKTNFNDTVLKPLLGINEDE